MDILTLSHVSKSFGGAKVIDDLSFSVPDHGVFGFIGENGAGKTTTMKMILGLLRADGGEILVNGEKVRFGRSPANRFIGYLPDVPEFYGFMTPPEYLELCRSVAEMRREDIRRRSGELLELVGLSGVDKKIRGFSRGMKQRLGIAQALLTEPKLLICDEPTSALDPVGRREILQVLSSVREQTAVLFSTHILPDVERICDRVLLLHKGKAAMQGSLSEIRSLHRKTGFEVEFANPSGADAFLSAFPSGQRRNRLLLGYGADGPSMDEAVAFIAGNRLTVRRIEAQEQTLEALFMEVTGE